MQTDKKGLFSVRRAQRSGPTDLVKNSLEGNRSQVEQSNDLEKIV
jgi:hypothetical protein